MNRISPSGRPTLRIVLTGIDGSGKSTAARDLTRTIEARGGSAILLRNPAGRRTMAAWWAALGRTPGPRVQDALETVTRVVNVLVNEVRLRGFDGVVVLDRGLECQLALREARGLPRGVVVPWLQRVLPAADVVAHFELPVDVALERIRRRATDDESPAVLASLAAGYRRLPAYGSFTLVDASADREAVMRFLLGLVPDGAAGPGPAGRAPAATAR
ncbi:AAA family ATPase [Arthrobacter sp. MDT2-16]